MGFGEAISTCLTKYVVFSGRARRSEYWWFALFYLIVDLVAVVIDAVLGTSAIQYIVIIALFLPTLAVAMRRLHDTGRAGWWILFGIVPIVGWITLIVFYCQDSESDNQYGPAPKWTPQRAW